MIIMSEMSKCNTAQLGALPPRWCYIALFTAGSAPQVCLHRAVKFKALRQRVLTVYGGAHAQTLFLEEFYIKSYKLAVIVHI